MQSYIAQSIQPTLGSFKTVIFSTFLKVAMATSNFMNEVYNGGFAPEYNLSILKDTIALFQDYVYGSKNQEIKSKTSGKNI